jgi:2-polyprenyl-3-methyl-5-hydroxy-6-metoxy-1,4-benzoquinol methylase
MSIKKIEINRFNKFSEDKINLFLNSKLKINIDRYPKYIRTPYEYYERQILYHSDYDNILLDLCCGDGIHSFVSVSKVKKVVAIDFSEKSIEICNFLKQKLGFSNIEFHCFDVDEFDYNIKFDIITIAGSLSYFNHTKLFDKISYLLKDNGKLVLVDSLNDNIFYRINRYFHFLFNRRSYYTIKNMPYKRELINKIQKNFIIIDSKDFGIFIFLVPILKLFFSELVISNLLNKADNYFYNFSKFSFKTVIVAKKIKT